MASKQLGKLRQWAGEKISTEKKTVATDDFKDLEVEVERRHYGMERVYENSQSYHRYLMKKKDIGDGELKMLPVEALGRVMVAHGQEFGTDSAYGHSLCALGDVHIKVADLQEQFGESMQTVFLNRLEGLIAEVAQYHALRKKLKSRRLAYDAVVAQAQKTKKESEKAAADEEVNRARARFEEMSTAVQNQMERIQDGEMDQFRDLGRLMELELKFAQGWVDALLEVKADWPEAEDVYRVKPDKLKGLTHILQPPAQPNEDLAAPTNKRSSSSRRSVDSAPSSRSVSAERPDSRPKHQRTTSTATSGSVGRKSSVSMTNWASSAVSSLPFMKKDQRNRSGTFETLGGEDRKGDESEDEVSLSRPHSRRDSNTNSGPATLTRKKSGKMAPPPPPARSRAQSTTLSEAHSSKHNSPRIPPRSLPPSQSDSPKTTVKALYAFEGKKDDELALEAGDEITVISKPSDTWWMGECKGSKGLFPATYTEEMPKRPPLPVRPPTLSKSVRSQSATPNEFSLSRHSSTSGRGRKKDERKEETVRDEPFGDHYSAPSPPPTTDRERATHSPELHSVHSGGEGGPDYGEDDHKNLIGSSKDYNQNGGVNPGATSNESGGTPSATSSPVAVVRQLTRSFSGKKAPPPPPRRATSTSANRANSFSSNGVATHESPFLSPSTPGATSSWNSSGAGDATPTRREHSGRDRDYENPKSPFEEGDGDGEVDSASLSSFALSHKCRTCSCDDFQQSLFKKNGVCNGCYHIHG